MDSVIAEGLTKTYFLKSGATPLFRRREKQSKTALSEVSFRIAAGETVGIIGENGSGKSTLLKLISGVTAATKGRLLVQGSVSALLELGAGFHPEYTGIENIYLNGSLRGKSRREIRAKLPEILDFAQIGRFAEQPLKTYSDGMFLRLAFAAAVLWEPEILVVDEALAVGDFLFQAKCFSKMRELRKRGVTILYVSHDIDAIRRFCSRVLWLEEGRLRMDGSVEEVTAAYMAAAIGQGETRTGDRFGEGKGALGKVEGPTIWKYGEEVSVTAEVTVPEDAEGAAVSMAVKNREGLDLLVLSTTEQGLVLKRGKTQKVKFRFINPFCSGRYGLALGLEKPTYPITYYDYWEGAMAVEAVADTPCLGSFHLSAEVEIYEEIQSNYSADQQG